MATIRVPGLSCSIFTLGSTTHIDDLQNATLTIETKTAEAKAIKDRWDFPWPVGSNAKIEADVFVATSADLVTAAHASSVVTFAITTGANAYSGNAIISTAGHTFNREELQMQKVSLSVQGDVTITAPS